MSCRSRVADSRAAAAAITLAALLCLLGAPAFCAPFYHLVSAVKLPGKAPEWDYVTLDPARPHLFIGRRGAGVTVFDTKRQAPIATIAQSSLADAALLIPEFDRGYTANEDGSSTIFRLSTLATIGRITVGHDNDSAFYDPTTKQVMFTQGDSRRLVFIDAASGAPRGTLAMDSAKLDGAAPDGHGGMVVAMRDRNALAHVDVATRRLLATWPVTGCTQPTGLALDVASQRVFVGCRGPAPVLAVLDAQTGRVITTKAIGRGNDGVAYDTATRQIFTSNGVDANLVIYRQDTQDSYALVEADTTRPYARTMAVDHATGRLYSVTAEGAADPAEKINTSVAPFYPNTYFDGTFLVLTFARD